MDRRLLLVVIGAFCLLLSVRAEACSCVQVGEAIDAVKTQDAVFQGRVIATAVVLVDKNGDIAYKDAPEPPDAYVQRIVVLRVDELFKGNLPPLVTLVTGSGAGDCGYGFEEGKQYVVFATKASGRVAALMGSPVGWTTSTCTFTQPAGQATSLLTKLRSKYTPREPIWLQWPPSNSG